MDYFEHVVNHLTYEEVSFLGILMEKDATASFKAIKRNDLLEISGLSIANFRKTIGKLTAAHLVNVIMGGRAHKVFLTTYGQLALNKSLEEVEY